MARNLILNPNPTSSKSTNLDLSKIRQLIGNFNVGKFYELTDNEGERENYEVTDNISYTLYIAESRPHECPKLQIKIAGEETKALTFRYRASCI